jgi:retron-type reverse transcriptase
VNHDLYRLLYKPDLYEVVYEEMKSAPGNMTAGVDGKTLDGFSIKTIMGLIDSLKDESFQFKPAKRTYIPKANGKMRPLGIPSPRDKIVQGVIHMILEAIYDSPQGPYFLETSHGFRSGRSCHSALRVFREKWTGMVWIVEGDIKACFDEIDHHTLVGLIRRKIHDERFINLLWKALRAGYLWMKTRKDTLLGLKQAKVPRRRVAWAGLAHYRLSPLCPAKGSPRNSVCVWQRTPVVLQGCARRRGGSEHPDSDFNKERLSSATRPAPGRTRAAMGSTTAADRPTSVPYARSDTAAA